MSPTISCDSVYKIFGANANKLLADSNGSVDAKQFQEAGCIVGVNNASFDVEKGEMLVVMGLSGSGKSTLLRCISRLTDATAGKILVDGEDICLMNNKQLVELRREKMGMVFQNFALLPHKTVIENIAFPLQVKGVSTENSMYKALEMVELVGLKGRENYFPRELSGGHQQRVGIARSLAVEPDIWFLDEPFSIVLNPATDYVKKFTEDVPREKVLKIESIMDPKDTNASDNLKVSKDDIIESVAEKILNSKEIIKVIDPKDSSEVGSINPSKVIKVLFGG